MSGAIGPGTFVLGCALLAVTLASAGITARLLVSRRAAHLRGAPRAVALGLLSVAGVLAIHLVPLALGAMTRGTVLLAALALALAATRIRRAAPAQDRRAPPAQDPDADDPDPRAGTRGWALAAAGVLVSGAAWLAYVEYNATFEVNSVDALSFHLPGVIRFIQTGTLWQTTQYLTSQAQGNYPQYGDVLLLAFALPWHSLALVRYADPPLLALAAVSVYGIARELRAPAPAATLVALALVAIRPTVSAALQDAITDPGCLAGFAAGVLFLLRHWRTGARSDLALSGLGLGLALGTKWYALTDVPVVIAIWALAAAICRRGRPRWRADLGWLALATALAGGIWMLRNLLLTGDPVFDYRLHVFGLTVLPAPANPARDRLAATIAGYLGDSGILRRYVWPVFRSDFGLTGLLCALAWLGTAGGLLLHRLRAGSRAPGARSAPDPRPAILLFAAALCAIAYLLTPFSAQGPPGMPILVAANTRYGVPALLLAAPLLAICARRLGRARIGLEALLLVLVVIDLRRHLPIGAGRIAANAVVLLALAGAGCVIVRRDRAAARPARGGLLRAGATAAAALACATALLAYHYQRVLARRSYLPSDPTVAYVLAHSPPSGLRIAITGEWTAQGLVPVAPLFGARMQNRLTYLGTYVEHRLQDYTSAGPFLAALAREHYQYLEVGTGFPPRPDPIQQRWAARAGYRVVLSDPRLVLMRPPPRAILAGR